MTLYKKKLSNMFCQGDMFQPYKVILRPSKETDPRAVYALLHCGIPNVYKFFVQNCKIHKLVYIELVWNSTQYILIRRGHYQVRIRKKILSSHLSERELLLKSYVYGPTKVHKSTSHHFFVLCKKVFRIVGLLWQCTCYVAGPIGRAA